jgi:DNA-binding LacI/PurR family transcriptional regulator
LTTRKPRTRATLRDVAQDAGVSFSAVSKALRAIPGVSAAMRARVQESAQRLGYRPHAAARGMRGQTFTLGVLISDLRNPFFSEIFAGLDAALASTPYQPFFGIGGADPATENAIVDSMIDRQMDGVILIGPTIQPPDLQQIAKEIPTAVIGVHLPKVGSLDTINNDDELGGRLVVQHLHALGRQRITYLTLDPMPQKDGVTVYRERGYREEMQRLGLDKHIRILGVTSDSEQIRHVALSLLRSSRPPDAIFCWTDYVAFEVIGAARELGLSVPGDVAVVGYDNTPFCRLPQNALTSVDQSGRLLGQQAGRLLLDRIAGRTTSQHFVVTPTLVARASTEVLAPSTDGSEASRRARSRTARAAASVR